jgi:hypothetical protein
MRVLFSDERVSENNVTHVIPQCFAVLLVNHQSTNRITCPAFRKFTKLRTLQTKKKIADYLTQYNQKHANLYFWTE